MFCRPTLKKAKKTRCSQSCAPAGSPLVRGPRLSRNVSPRTVAAPTPSERTAVPRRSISTLLSLGVGPGAEVITSPITFASTANVIVHCGATPVFCDVTQDTLNIDPDALSDAITPRTQAIIVVHFAGHPCDMDEIGALAAHHGIPVIEDAAHAVEAEYRGRPTGSLGRAAAFSFYATKNITSGEGGMLTTNDEDLAGQADALALHGISRDAWKRYGDDGYKHWEIIAPGYKYNMFDIQAALVDAQMDRIDQFWERRRQVTNVPTPPSWRFRVLPRCHGAPM